jgi:hypothetical protein
MNALTVCQPYAELIARLEKPIENRGWYTPYRGSLAIHAGRSKSWMDDAGVYGIDDYRVLAFGAIVAVSQLVACLDIGKPWPDRFAPLQRHEHANGRWCWILEDVRRLTVPIPCAGARLLWSVPPAIEARILAEMA